MTAEPQPWWIAVLAAALVLLGVVGLVVFLLTGRRDRVEKWDRLLAVHVPDARWFADSLVPAVVDRARSVHDVQGRWRSDVAAVLSTETVLYRLADTAPDSEREARAQVLAEATEALREALDDDVRLRADGDDRAAPEALADSGRRVAELRRALHAALPPGGSVG